MAFMIPIYEKGRFATVSVRGEFEWRGPAEYYSAKDFPEGHEVEFEKGWFCHLSAPGYMDQTDWDGPFHSIDEAREYLSQQYDCDPDTGDDLEEESDENDDDE